MSQGSLLIILLKHVLGIHLKLFDYPTHLTGMKYFKWVFMPVESGSLWDTTYMLGNGNIYIASFCINKTHFATVTLPVSQFITELSTDIDGNDSPVTAHTHISSSEEIAYGNRNGGNQFVSNPFADLCKHTHTHTHTHIYIYIQCGLFHGAHMDYRWRVI